MEQIAIIGTGLIGRAWAMVFARAGHNVRIWDPVAGVPQAALGLIGQSLQDLSEAGLITEAPGVVAARISAAASMEDCVAGAAHVQENGPERVEPKRELFARLDALCGPDVVLASSTSGIPASAFTEGLAGRARCLVAHPVNPPYLVPLVELVGAPWTAPEVVARTRALMARVGQVPVTAMKETRGFVLNRLQAALVAEAFRLVRDGVMSVEDVDACVKDGLGLRWSFMGPFETIDLNAPGGVADYAARFGGLMGGITEEQTPFLYDEATVARVTAERRAALPLEKIGERSAWRDRRLMGVLGHKGKVGESDKLNSKGSFPEDHWCAFLSAAGSTQKWIGDAPDRWFKSNGLESDARVSRLPSIPMSRKEVKEIAQDPNLDPLTGYVVAMAWGAQSKRFGHPQVAWAHREKIREVCQRVRSDPTLDRHSAYELFSGKNAIQGLGPSFATKLLYFFRRESDFYIMDQWSSWAVNLLCGKSIVKMYFDKNKKPTNGSVLLTNNSSNYAAFCAAIDELAKRYNETNLGAPLTGELMEERLFDIGGKGKDSGAWRRYVRARPVN